MVYVVEEAFNVSLDKPLSAIERLLNTWECSLRTSLWSETMWGVFKTALIYSFQNHSDNLLQKFIHKWRNTQRSHLSVFLRNVNSLWGFRLIRLVFERINQLLNMGYTEAVNGFSVNSFSHITLFGIYALVGYVVHLFIKQYPIQTFELVLQVGTMLC